MIWLLLICNLVVLDGTSGVTYENGMSDNVKIESYQLIDGSVGPGNFTYYTLQKPGRCTIFLSSSEGGDADLYVSSRNGQPTYLIGEYDYQSATCGLDRVDVPPHAKRPLTIGVYGHPTKVHGSDYRLYVFIYEPEMHPINKNQPDEYTDVTTVYFDEHSIMPADFDPAKLDAVDAVGSDVASVGNFGEVLMKVLQMLLEVAVDVLL